MNSKSDSSDRDLPDQADVVFHPPVLLGGFLLLGFTLRAVVPLAFAPAAVVSVVGPVIAVLAFAFSLWAATRLSRMLCAKRAFYPAQDHLRIRESYDTLVQVLLSPINIAIYERRAGCCRGFSESVNATCGCPPV